MECNFEQLSSITLAKIKSFGIKDNSVFTRFKKSCRILKAYLEENNLEFSFDSGQKWLSEIRPCEPTTRAQRNVYGRHRRAVLMLNECQEGKFEVWRVYSHKVASRPETPEYLQALRSYAESLQISGMAEGTVDNSMSVISDFLIYLEKSGKYKLNEVMPCDVTRYFACEKFSNRTPNGVKGFAYKLNSFLSFLEGTGFVPEKKLSFAVPKSFAKQESIVAILSEKAVESIRNGSIKTDAGTAARDHAMILLGLRLGIRQSDIIKMKLSDIDWENDSISFVQRKIRQ